MSHRALKYATKGTIKGAEDTKFSTKKVFMVYGNGRLYINGKYLENNHQKFDFSSFDTVCMCFD